MQNADKDHSAYVERVREENQTYVRALLGDLEALRICVADLESTNARLQQELRALRAEIAFRGEEEEQLKEKLSQIRAESEQRLTQFEQLEQHNSNLANLYVASYQLHGTLRREAILAAIQEIVLNLVGSEEFAIFSGDGAGEPRLLAAVGLSEGDVDRRDPHIVSAMENGQTWVRNGDAQTKLNACVPLKIDGRVTGFIAIYRLLPQKPSIEPLDHELFDLLATHAGTALYFASVDGRSA